MQPVDEIDQRPVLVVDGLDSNAVLVLPRKKLHGLASSACLQRNTKPGPRGGNRRRNSVLARERRRPRWRSRNPRCAAYRACARRSRAARSRPGSAGRQGRPSPMPVPGSERGRRSPCRCPFRHRSRRGRADTPAACACWGAASPAPAGSAGGIPLPVRPVRQAQLDDRRLRRELTITWPVGQRRHAGEHRRHDGDLGGHFDRGDHGTRSSASAAASAIALAAKCATDE